MTSLALSNWALAAKNNVELTLKVPSKILADDRLNYFFIIFQRK